MRLRAQVDPRIESFNVCCNSPRVPRKAGSRPNSSPLAIETPPVNARIRQSGAGRMMCSPSADTIRTSTCSPTIASASPSRPPKPASSNPSVRAVARDARGCAERQPSRSPAAVPSRAPSSRLATFRQAMSSTSVTTDIRINSGCENSCLQLSEALLADFQVERGAPEVVEDAFVGGRAGLVNANLPPRGGQLCAPARSTLPASGVRSYTPSTPIAASPMRAPASESAASSAAPRRPPSCRPNRRRTPEARRRRS